MVTDPSELQKPQSGSLSEGRAVLFILAGCELGIPIGSAREIIRVTDITKMPKAPPFVEGVINLRGKIVPVLDLKKRFEMPLLERTEETRILIVQLKDQSMGLLVDRIAEVLRFVPGDVEPASEPVLNIGVDFIEGIIRSGSRQIVLLRTERVFSIDEIKAISDQ